MSMSKVKTINYNKFGIIYIEAYIILIATKLN